jgi:oxaloacetate decarboxylase gamma subunit
MQATIMAQGVDLMLYGMGSVFVFLTLLVFATRAMSWAVNRFFPEPIRVVAKSSLPLVATANTPVDPKVLLIIQDAVRQHRANHR